MILISIYLILFISIYFTHPSRAEEGEVTLASAEEEEEERAEE